MYIVITDLYTRDSHLQPVLLEKVIIDGITYELLDHALMVPRYEVLRYWGIKRRSRYYSDKVSAQAEWYRQTQEAIGERDGLNANFSPANDHQRNGAIYRNNFESEIRQAQMEMHL